MRVLDARGKPIYVRQNGSHVRVWVGRGARPGYQDHTPFEVDMKVSALRSGAKRARRMPVSGTEPSRSGGGSLTIHAFG